MTQEEVMDKHPKIFRERNMSPRETCMCWGLEVGKGWLPVIDEHCSRLEKAGVDVVAKQVKQKYGGLRFYWEPENEETCDRKKAGELVRDMEKECGETCEDCGAKPATTKGSKGWITCLCEDCRNKPEEDWVLDDEDTVNWN